MKRSRCRSRCEERAYDAYLLHPDSLVAHPCQVTVSRRGLLARRLDPGPVAAVPPSVGTWLCVPWPSVSGFSANETDVDPEGRDRQVLEVVTDAGSLFFLLDAPCVAELLTSVGRWSSRWERSRRRRGSTADGEMVTAGAAAAAATRRVETLLRSGSRRASAPTPSLARRAVGPLVSLARRAVGPLVSGAAWTAAWTVAWVAAFGRLVGLSARGAAGPVAAVVRHSWPARAAAFGLTKLSEVVGWAWAGFCTWGGATLRVMAVPVLALLRPVGTLVLRAFEPLRRRLATTVVGLLAAAAWRQAGAVVTRLAAAGRGAGNRPGLHRRLRVVVGSGALAVMVAGASLAGLTGGGTAVSGAARAHYRGGLLSAVPTTPGATSSSSMIAMVDALQGQGKDNKPLNLPAAAAPPTPAPPSLANQPPLAPHEVFGFAPYWNLPMSTGFDVNGLTTIAYFSIGVNANGTLDQSGSGWNGYESQEFANLVTRAHAAGDRVVLTVNCFDQSSLNQLTSTPAVPATLAQAILHAVEAKNLDGVNIDFEGQGAGDQVGLTNLITQVSAVMHGANPHYQVTMDTYASSAGDPSGFYNIKALAPAVDGFFVMAYQLNLQGTPNPASPLTSSMFSDLSTAEQYAAAVPPGKVILGVPYYGYEWPTTNGTMSAQATGGATPVTYSQVMAGGTPVYWDPITDTAWTSYQVGGQWYEDYFEDPTSLYLLAQLAQFFSLDGVGIWALGMDGNSPSMLAALDGFAPTQKGTLAGPTATSPSTVPPGGASTTTAVPGSTSTGPHATTPPSTPPPVTPPSSTSTTAPPTTTTTPPTTTVGSGGGTANRFSGIWQGQTVSLTWQSDTPPPASGTPTYLGTLTGFQTNDPGYSCLDSGAGLAVWRFSSDVGVDVVVAEQPTNCTSGTFTFPATSSTAGNGSSTAGNGSSTAGNGSSTGGNGSSPATDTALPTRSGG